MDIELKEVEQIWTDETTRYWFDVDGVNYCISDCAGELSLLDSDGHPIEPRNDHAGIEDALAPHYQEAKLAD